MLGKFICSSKQFISRTLFDLSEEKEWLIYLDYGGDFDRATFPVTKELYDAISIGDVFTLTLEKTNG